MSSNAGQDSVGAEGTENHFTRGHHLTCSASHVFCTILVSHHVCSATHVFCTMSVPHVLHHTCSALHTCSAPHVFCPTHVEYHRELEAKSYFLLPERPTFQLVWPSAGISDTTGHSKLAICSSTLIRLSHSLSHSLHPKSNSQIHTHAKSLPQPKLRINISNCSTTRNKLNKTVYNISNKHIWNSESSPV